MGVRALKKDIYKIVDGRLTICTIFNAMVALLIFIDF
jgi:hypothetical protein